MRRLVAVLAIVASVFAMPIAAQEAEPIQVMILGTYHFANTNSDVANMEVDDVTTPSRQAELARLAESLAAWEPDKVLVEAQRPGPRFIDERYAEYSPAMLLENRNETVQIGYRLASMLGLDTVHAFDERSSEGEPDYFPFGRVQEWAAGNGQSDAFEALVASIQRRVEAMSNEQGQRSIAANLIGHNEPETIAADHRDFYYDVLRFGDGDNQAGAELNSYWYMRNAKMFAKIGLIAEPGDRVFVLVGGGHAYWLRHFVENTPGYELVDALPYLRAATSGDEPE